MTTRLQRALSGLPLRACAVLVGALIACLVTLGALHAAGAGHLAAFALDEERNVPTLFSAALLGAAAIAALGLRGLASGSRAKRLAPAGLAALLAFMALDEVGEIHERGERILAVDWQTLYLPVAAAGAVAWLLMLAAMWRHRLARALFMGGAAAWVVVQVLEFFEYDAADVRVPAFDLLSTIEELLEMAGTAMWLFALLVFLRGAFPARARGRG